MEQGEGQSTFVLIYAENEQQQHKRLKLYTKLLSLVRLI